MTMEPYVCAAGSVAHSGINNPAGIPCLCAAPSSIPIGSPKDQSERARLRFFWECVRNGKLRYLESEASCDPFPANFENGGRNWHDVLQYKKAIQKIADLDNGFPLEACR